MTHAGHQESKGARQYRCGQFEGESRLAADGDPQQSAVVAVRLKVVVLNPGVKRRCGRADDTERKASAFVPDEYRFLNRDTDEPLCVARANAMRRRCRQLPDLSKPGKNSPQLAGSCASAAKTSLGGRPTLTDGTKTNRGRVEEVKIDGFASEHTNLLACVGEGIYGP